MTARRSGPRCFLCGRRRRKGRELCATCQPIALWPVPRDDQPIDLWPAELVPVKAS